MWFIKSGAWRHLSILFCSKSWKIKCVKTQISNFLISSRQKFSCCLSFVLVIYVYIYLFVIFSRLKLHIGPLISHIKIINSNQTPLNIKKFACVCCHFFSEAAALFMFQGTLLPLSGPPGGPWTLLSGPLARWPWTHHAAFTVGFTLWIKNISLFFRIRVKCVNLVFLLTPLSS